MCKDVWGMSEGERITIRFNNEGQPIREDANKLSSFLGSLARNGGYAPLNYEDWRLLPKEYKDEMERMIEVGNFFSLGSRLNLLYMDLLYTKWYGN